jgi:hypothetical protein
MIDASEVDWTALSPQARETLRLIALRLALGRNTYAEIAEETGLSIHAISNRMQELRVEILDQLGI